MGHTFSCDRCDSTHTSKVFTFSEDLVLKLADGIEPKPEKIEKGQSRDINDRTWRERISCIDRSHSILYGLDEDTFNQLLNKLDHTLRDIDQTSLHIPGRQEMVECYIKNRENELCCASAVEEYTDNIDLFRLKKIKQYA